MIDSALDTYPVIGGGPLRQLERALRIARDDAHDLARRVAVVVTVTYVPILVVGIVRLFTTGTWPIMLREAATHVRPLVALPILLAAEAFIDARAADAGSYLLRSGLVPAGRRPALRSLIARTGQLRDSGLVEVAMFVLAVALPLVRPVMTREHAASALWSFQPSLFLARFLLLRLMWRWFAWGVYLARLVRLPLACRVSHPDRVAGLSPLAGPSMAFCLVVVAVGSNVSASWGDQMRFEGIAASTLLRSGVLLAVVCVVVTMAPLAALTVPLMRLRWSGVGTIGALASRASDAFEQRFADAPGDVAVSASEMQSMNDLGGVFERVAGIRPVVAPRSLVATLVVSVTLPFLPLVVADVGALPLLARVAHAFF